MTYLTRRLFRRDQGELAVVAVGQNAGEFHHFSRVDVIIRLFIPKFDSYSLVLVRNVNVFTCPGGTMLFWRYLET